MWFAAPSVDGRLKVRTLNYCKELISQRKNFIHPEM